MTVIKSKVRSNHLLQKQTEEHKLVTYIYKHRFKKKKQQRCLGAMYKCHIQRVLCSSRALSWSQWGDATSTAPCKEKQLFCVWSSASQPLLHVCNSTMAILDSVEGNSEGFKAWSAHRWEMWIKYSIKKNPFKTNFLKICFSKPVFYFT